MRDMAKIALVNPPVLFWEEGFEALQSDRSPPLGLYILASEAKRAGHEVRMVDLGIQPRPYGKALREILAFEPDLVGLAGVTVNVHNASRFATDLKKHRPDTAVVLGGPHGTALPEETLLRFPDFDALVLGEGEETFRELLENPAGGEAWESVAGLALPRNGACRFTPPRERLKDLDRIAFPA